MSSSGGWVFTAVELAHKQPNKTVAQPLQAGAAQRPDVMVSVRASPSSRLGNTIIFPVWSISTLATGLPMLGYSPDSVWLGQGISSHFTAASIRMACHTYADALISDSRDGFA